MDEISLVHLPHPHPPGERRSDVRVIDLRFGVVDGGLVRLHGCHQLIDHEPLRVVALLVEHLLGDQIFVALEHQPAVGELRLVLGLLGDGLIELRLIRPWVDLREQVARLHVLAFRESHLVQFAIDARLDRDRVKRLDRAEAVEINGHVALFDRPRHDGHR